MYYAVNVTRLEQEGVLTADQVSIIRDASKQAMILLAVNTLLCGGIVTAALGLVVLLADAMAVAVTGALFLLTGVLVLTRGGPVYRMFGNASALIGAGMLCAGAGVELAGRLPGDSAGLAMLALGAAVGGFAAWGLLKGNPKARFVAGAVLVMGTLLHLAGLLLGGEAGLFGAMPAPAVMFYSAAVVALAGFLTDVRVFTALAIVPFAQMLNTSTGYSHASYSFFSPEPTLSILQMAALVVVSVLVMRRVSDRIARHAGILAIMGFVVGNLSFLVASLWGDAIGDTSSVSSARISADVYSVIWAVVLAAGAAWAARRGQRGLFNASLVFAAIHAYTQGFSRFRDEPLIFVLGGLAAIPLAWGLWRLNQRFAG